MSAATSGKNATMPEKNVLLQLPLPLPTPAPTPQVRNVPPPVTAVMLTEESAPVKQAYVANSNPPQLLPPPSQPPLTARRPIKTCVGANASYPPPVEVAQQLASHHLLPPPAPRVNIVATATRWNIVTSPVHPKPRSKTAPPAKSATSKVPPAALPPSPLPPTAVRPLLLKSAIYATPHPYVPVNALIKNITSPLLTTSGNVVPQPLFPAPPAVTFVAVITNP